jgi:hypothetical protein
MMRREYLSYLLEHKTLVFLQCVKLGVPWQGVTHDLTKFGLAEFSPYARKFYGPDVPSNDDVAHLLGSGTEPPKWTEWSVQLAFDRAWLYHQHRNPHHWQFWVLNEDDHLPRALEMPRRFTIEMLADWCAMSIKFTNQVYKVRDWYIEHYSKIVLHPQTRARIEFMMGLETTYVTRDSIAWAEYCKLSSSFDSHVGIQYPRIL